MPPGEKERYGAVFLYLGVLEHNRPTTWHPRERRGRKRGAVHPNLLNKKGRGTPTAVDDGREGGKRGKVKNPRGTGRSREGRQFKSKACVENRIARSSIGGRGQRGLKNVKGRGVHPSEFVNYTLRKGERRNIIQALRLIQKDTEYPEKGGMVWKGNKLLGGGGEKRTWC